MKIAIDARKVADFGIGTYIRGLLRALIDSGGHHYIALAPSAAASLLPGGVEHIVVEAPQYSVRELVVVGRAITRARVDLFHAPHYVVPFTDIPMAVTVHDLIHLRHANPLARVYARQMIRRAIRTSRVVLTVTEAVRQDIVRTFGCPSGKVVVTPNGADQVFVAAGPGAEGRYFLFVGNDKPHKNVEALVEAFARASIGGAQLVLAGGTFDRFASRPGVILAGFVKEAELAALYRGALAVVLPSHDEGFGLPALEAMACGAPVITSDAPALVEVTGEAAIHVTPSIEALATAMMRVAADDSLRQRLSRSGPARARDFTWERCAAITRAAYEQAVR